MKLKLALQTEVNWVLLLASCQNAHCWALDWLHLRPPIHPQPVRENRFMNSSKITIHPLISTLMFKDDVKNLFLQFLDVHLHSYVHFACSDLSNETDFLANSINLKGSPKATQLLAWSRKSRSFWTFRGKISPQFRQVLRTHFMTSMQHTFT